MTRRKYEDLFRALPLAAFVSVKNAVAILAYRITCRRMIVEWSGDIGSTLTLPPLVLPGERFIRLEDCYEHMWPSATVNQNALATLRRQPQLRDEACNETCFRECDNPKCGEKFHQRKLVAVQDLKLPFTFGEGAFDFELYYGKEEYCKQLRQEEAREWKRAEWRRQDEARRREEERRQEETRRQEAAHVEREAEELRRTAESQLLEAAAANRQLMEALLRPVSNTVACHACSLLTILRCHPPAVRHQALRIDRRNVQDMMSRVLVAPLCRLRPNSNYNILHSNR